MRLTFLLLLAWSLSVGPNATMAQQNSMRKNRIVPSDFAAQAGSAVQWRSDLKRALEESRTTGKPLFWYVPSLPGTFMDRKPVIDRYMLAGPFSWPAIIERLNRDFIPIRAVPSPEEQQTYDLLPYKFVEPGFVVIYPPGEASDKQPIAIDQLTTFTPDWFEQLLVRLKGGSTAKKAAALSNRKVPASTALLPAWKAFRQGQYEYPIDELAVPDRDQVEKRLLQGMFLFRQGRHQQAQTVWRQTRALAADHPLAWKALAEAENWGPFVRGFEVHRELPPQALNAGFDSRGSAAPTGVYNETLLRNHSLQFLLGMQRQDGAWVDSDYDFGGADSLPNVHVAVTSLCGLALLEARPRSETLKSQVERAIQLAGEYVADSSHLNPIDRDEILWAQAYRTRFLAALCQTDAANRQRFQSALQEAVAGLESIQTPQGSWYHEYANPFVTATALTALFVAEQAGANIDQQKIRNGVEALSRDRFANGAFPYSSRRQTPTGNRNGDIPAAAGRMPLCELALWQRDASDQSQLEFALQAAFEHHPLLAVAYKYDNHTSTKAYGGFFFWYDMRSRAEAICFIQDDDLRRQLAARQRELVNSLPELDGCFVDSHELGRCYGTAMALLTLATLDRCNDNNQPRPVDG